MQLRVYDKNHIGIKGEISLNKCVLIPDSFKGTMSSIEICRIMKDKIVNFFPACEVVEIPVADGGEGTVDCFLSAIGGQKIFVKVCNPYFEEIETFYALIDGGKTAIIEMASCAGLPLVEHRKDPAVTTTYGVGQLIADAVNRGCDKIILGLGGSCTNDGGTGMASALGVKFFDKDNKKFIPVGSTLNRVEKIDISSFIAKGKGIEIIAMCDVDNPLCGDNGAARVFGPQKGADEELVQLLDANLKHLAEVIWRDLHMDIENILGAGAAGGMGAGMVAFINGELRKGIDIVLDIVNFDRLIEGADLIFTGEGKIDEQSLRGKVVVGVGSRAKIYHIPVIAVVGDIGNGIESIYDHGICSIISINSLAIPFDEAKLRSKQDLAFTFENIIRLLKVTRCGTY